MTRRICLPAAFMLVLLAASLDATEFEEAAGVIASEASIFSSAGQGVRILAVRHALGDIQADDIVTRVTDRLVGTLQEADTIAMANVPGGDLGLTIRRGSVRKHVIITRQITGAELRRQPVKDDERPAMAALVRDLDSAMRRRLQSGLTAAQMKDADDAVAGLMLPADHFVLACKGLGLADPTSFVTGAYFSHYARLCTALADLLVSTTDGTVRNNVGFVLADLADPLTPVSTLVTLANDRSDDRDGEARSKAPSIAGAILISWKPKNPDIAMAYAHRLIAGGFVEALIPLTRMTTRHLPDNAVTCLAIMREFYPAEVAARSRPVK
jgi:hypothetical protein